MTPRVTVTTSRHAPSMWRPTRISGRPGEVLDVADRPLEQGHQQDAVATSPWPGRTSWSATPPRGPPRPGRRRASRGPRRATPPILGRSGRAGCSASPECGPDPVTIVPSTRTAAPTPAVTHASVDTSSRHEQLPRLEVGEPSGDHPSSEPRSSIAESATITIDRRKERHDHRAQRHPHGDAADDGLDQHPGHQPDRHEQQRPSPAHPGEHRPHAGQGEESHDAGQRARFPNSMQLVDPLLLVEWDE